MVVNSFIYSTFFFMVFPKKRCYEKSEMQTKKCKNQININNNSVEPIVEPIKVAVEKQQAILTN